MSAEHDRRCADGQRRLFFALWPTQALRERIVRAVDPILERCKARRVSTENLHLTLAFLGAVRESDLKATLDAGDATAFEPFELTIERLASWRRAHVVALMIEPTPTPLAQLVDRLREQLSARHIPVDQKEFRAHVTLARDWRDRSIDVPIGPLPWKVEGFALVQSRPGKQGSEYQLVRHWARDRARVE